MNDNCSYAADDDDGDDCPDYNPWTDIIAHGSRRFARYSR